MEHKEPFWLVWNPRGDNPQHKHRTPEEALRESERLAQMFPGQAFIVLQSVQAVVADNIQRTDLRPPDDIPF